MDEQITHIEYENDEGEMFYFDDHSNSLQFFNANKRYLLDVNDELVFESETFISDLYDTPHTISVSYTDIFDRYRGGIIEPAHMNLVRHFIGLLEQDSSNPNYQLASIGTVSKSRKSRKVRKGRKSRKVRKGRKSRKVRKGRKSRKVRKGRKSRR